VKHTVLVADSDRAFTTILREALEATRDYAVTVVHTGSAALETIALRPFDMVIVDTTLTDVPLPALIESARDARPAIRVMLIPCADNRIPAELQAVEAQGLLPKPFFIGDLPAIVRHAMELDDAIPLARLAELSEATPGTAAETEVDLLFQEQTAASAVALPDLAPLEALPESTAEAASPEPVPDAAGADVVSPRPEQSHDPTAGIVAIEGAQPEPFTQSADLSPQPPEPVIVTAPVEPMPPARPDQPAGPADDHPSITLDADAVRVIRVLQRELQARAILVTCRDQVLASWGSIGADQLADLARLIAARVDASSQMMRFLGDDDGFVELVLEEGRDVRVYTLRVTADVLLTVAASPAIALGTLRYRARQAAADIVTALR
jgi:DNA-binding NarL/FixJ family response regulator/predicted regulator of Ras-like GTPase activity (Roadblock/LC7/MglB family)